MQHRILIPGYIIKSSAWAARLNNISASTPKKHRIIFILNVLKSGDQAGGHFRGSVRHVGNIRHITTHIRRQHLIVGTDTASHVVKAVENIRIKVVFTKAEFGF